jgi:hypothetical protein
VKNLILIACCLLAACFRSETGGDDGHQRTRLLPLDADCTEMYNELGLDPTTRVFDVEVDIQQVAPGGANDVYYAVCHQRDVLTPKTIFGPGNIEFYSALPATVYVRFSPSSALTWMTDAAGSRDPSIDLIDSQNPPAPGDRPTCLPNKHVTKDDKPNNHQYIYLALCPPSTQPTQTDKYYTYYIHLKPLLSNGKVATYTLDPQIIHHPPMAAATP